MIYTYCANTKLASVELVLYQITSIA